MRILWFLPLFLILVAAVGAILLLLEKKKKAAAAPSPAAPAAGQAPAPRVTLVQRLQNAGKVLRAVFQGAVAIVVVMLVVLFVFNTIRDTRTKIKRPTSGAFLMDPTKKEEIIRTGLFFKKGEFIILEQDDPPHEFWVKNTTMNDVKISSAKRTLEAFSPGELKLSPGAGSEPFRVRVWVTQKRNLFGT